MNKRWCPGVVLLLGVVQMGWGAPTGQFVVDGLVVDTGEYAANETAKPAKPAKVFEPFTHWKENPVVRPAPVAVPVQKNVSEKQRLAEALRGERYEEALTICRTLLTREPNNMGVLRQAAALAAVEGYYSEASRYFEHLLELDRSDVKYRASWSGVLVRMKEWERAREQADLVLESDPDSMEARFTKTVLAVREGGPVGQITWWRNRSIPELFRAVNWLHADAANLLICLSPEEYIRLCDAVVGVGSATVLPEIVANLRRLEELVLSKHWEAALSVIDELMQRNVGVYSLQVQKSQCLFECGRVEDALAVLNVLTGLQPENGDVWFNLGFIYLRNGEYNKARVPFARSAKLLEDSRLSVFGLACALAGAGYMDKSYAMLNTLTPRAPAALTSWLEGDRPYLVAIREDPRYEDWLAGLVFVD